MGRAAGGDRQLPPPLFLSRLLEAARRSEWQGVEELGARQDLRQKGIGRNARARGIRQYRPGHQRPGELSSAARRIYVRGRREGRFRSEEHTSELQSLMRISYAVFCLKKKKQHKIHEKQNKQ